MAQNKLNKVTSPAYMQFSDGYGSRVSNNHNADYESQLQYITDALKGTAYETEWLGNPYNRGTEIHDTWFSKAGTAAREELRSKSLELGYQLLSKLREDKANTASSQVQDLRMAGVNPDLSGDVSAFSPSSAPELSTPDFGAFAQMAQEGTLTPIAVGSTLVSTISSAIGLVKEFQNISLLHNQSQAFDLDNLDKIDRYARQTIFDIIPWDDVDKLSSDSDVLPTEVTSSFDDRLQNALSWSRSSSVFKDPINAHRYESSLMRLRHSPMTKASLLKFKNDFLKERESFVRSTGSSFFSPDDETFKSLMKCFIDYDDEMRRLSLNETKVVDSSQRADIAENNFAAQSAQFDSIVLSGQDAKQVGELQSTETSNSLSEAKQRQATMKLLDGLYETLQSGMNDGGIKGGFSALALVLLTFVRSQMFSSLVSQGVSGWISNRNSRAHDLRVAAQKRSSNVR